MAKYKRNFYIELSHRYSKPNERKYYYYFLWRNKLNNSDTDFINMTQEEFVNKYLRKKIHGELGSGEKSFKMLQMWETTEEYQALKQELYVFRMNDDFYKLYDTYLEKAMQGDDKAVNALKTIKKEIESLNKSTKKASKNKSEEDEEFDME